MPKRTNPFQQLVYLLQHQLAEHATVTESKMMPDRETDSEVEVDIVIEATVGKMPIVIGVECTAKARPATVEWIREMIAKHGPLGIDKTVLVSKSGFSNEAKKKAAANGVSVLGLEKAKDVAWASYIEAFENLKTASFGYTVRQFQAVLANPGSIPEGTQFDVDSLIKIPEETKKVRFVELAHSIPRRTDVGEDVLRRWVRMDSEKRKQQSHLTLTLSPPDGTTIDDLEGNPHEISAINVFLDAHFDEAPIRLELAEFNGESIAFGTTKNVFMSGEGTSERKVLVSLVNNKEKPGAILLDMPLEDGRRVFPLKPANGSVGGEDMVPLIEEQIHQALIDEEEERCRAIEEKNKLDPETKNKKVKRRTIHKPWARGRHPRLCQETELLLKVSEYDYKLADPAFQDYCRSRGVLHIAGDVGSRRWLFCLDYSKSHDDYSGENDIEQLEIQSTDVDEPPSPETETGWKIVRIARAKLQDCWEMFVASEKSNVTNSQVG